MDKQIIVEQYSNPTIAQNNAYKYLGKTAQLFFSSRKDKKYQIYNPLTNKWVHFGQIGFSDFTKHQDPLRRQKYLLRATNIKGNWKNDKYSPNLLSISILWQ